MASSSRVGDSIAPHGCWSGGAVSSGSSNVLVNGKPAARISDSGTPHGWICPESNPPHGVVISGGSGSVFINGMSAARIGDATGCGSMISSGSSNVLMGG